MKEAMDIEYYTNFHGLVNSVEPRLVPPFVLGIIYGGLVMTAVWRKWWWLVVLIVLLPILLYVTSFLLPLGISVTYRVFFLGVVTLAVVGLAYYLA